MKRQNIQPDALAKRVVGGHTAIPKSPVGNVLQRQLRAGDEQTLQAGGNAP